MDLEFWDQTSDILDYEIYSVPPANYMGMLGMHEIEKPRKGDEWRVRPLRKQQQHQWWVAPIPRAIDLKSISIDFHANYYLQGKHDQQKLLLVRDKECQDRTFGFSPLPPFSTPKYLLWQRGQPIRPWQGGGKRQRTQQLQPRPLPTLRVYESLDDFSTRTK